MADEIDALLDDGFERRGSIPCALPMWLWTVTLQVEQNRPLRHVDEAVMALVKANVTDPDSIAKLMGVDDSEIVVRSIASLMRAGALRHERGAIRMTDGGIAALEKSQLKESVSREACVHFDPYLRRFRFAERSEERGPHDVRCRGMHQLPLPPQPLKRDLRNGHLQFQSALEASEGTRGAIDLLHVAPVGQAQPVFDEVDLELWHRVSDAQWRWRLLVDGVDDKTLTAAVRGLEMEQGDVLPFVPIDSRPEDGTLGRRLAALFDGGAPVGPAERLDALAKANEAILVVPAFPCGYADLGMLLHVVDSACDGSKKATRVVFGAPRADEKGRRDPFHEVSDRLREAGIHVDGSGDTLKHGALVADQSAFVARYHVAPQPGRDGRGVAWLECRGVDAEGLRSAMDGKDS